jgi:hypothetical protein
MLDLESNEWTRINSSSGGNGEFTAKLLIRLKNGDESAWTDLYHEVCHQNSVGEVAFVAVPHLVSIAKHSVSIDLTTLLLSTVGSIVASRQSYPTSAANLKNEWEADYKMACDEALVISADLLKSRAIGKVESFQLLSAISAFHEHSNLSLLLESGVDFYCPDCGEYILFGENT